MDDRAGLSGKADSERTADHPLEDASGDHTPSKADAATGRTTARAPEPSDVKVAGTVAETATRPKEVKPRSSIGASPVTGTSAPAEPVDAHTREESADSDPPTGTTTVEELPSALVKAIRTGGDIDNTARAARVRRRKVRKTKFGEHHYDWLWEVIGFSICLAIALLVFFAVPMFVTP